MRGTAFEYGLVALCALVAAASFAAPLAAKVAAAFTQIAAALPH